MNLFLTSIFIVFVQV